MTYQIGNVCPARIDADVLNYLPHESVLYQSVTGELDGTFLIAIDPRVTADCVIKVCRYCGSLYATNTVIDVAADYPKTERPQDARTTGGVDKE